MIDTYTSEVKSMKTVLRSLEIVSSLGLIGTYAIIGGIHRTISYEKAFAFEKTPKSSIFTLMNYYPILGYLTILFGIVLAALTFIRIYDSLSKNKKCMERVNNGIYM